MSRESPRGRGPTSRFPFGPGRRLHSVTLKHQRLLGLCGPNNRTRSSHSSSRGTRTPPRVPLGGVSHEPPFLFRRSVTVTQVLGAIPLSSLDRDTMSYPQATGLETSSVHGSHFQRHCVLSDTPRQPFQSAIAHRRPADVSKTNGDTAPPIIREEV